MAHRPGDLDRLIELRRVHPAFVAAVTQVHQARTAQVPLPPGST
jgi:hypothetical protein